MLVPLWSRKSTAELGRKLWRQLTKREWTCSGSSLIKPLYLSPARGRHSTQNSPRRYRSMKSMLPITSQKWGAHIRNYIRRSSGMNGPNNWFTLPLGRNELTPWLTKFTDNQHKIRGFGDIMGSRRDKNVCIRLSVTAGSHRVNLLIRLSHVVGFQVRYWSYSLLWTIEDWSIYELKYVLKVRCLHANRTAANSTNTSWRNCTGHGQRWVQRVP